MYTIADRQQLTQKGDTVSLTIEAPQITHRILPRQFVVVRVNETGERAPLTVAQKDVVTVAAPGYLLPVGPAVAAVTGFSSISRWCANSCQ